MDAFVYPNIKGVRGGQISQPTMIFFMNSGPKRKGGDHLYSSPIHFDSLTSICEIKHHEMTSRTFEDHEMTTFIKNLPISNQFSLI